MKTNARTLKTISLRRLGRLGAIALALGLAAPIAHADWNVVDKDANDKLNDIKSKLGDMYNQQRIGGYVKLGDIVPDPDKMVKKQDTSQGQEQCNSRPEKQQSVCQEIIQTQNAQISYMATMYDYAKKRDEQLRAIQDERSKIGSDDLGKLEDNTNKLLALNTQLSIDRQQLLAAMYAFDTRLKYLQAQQTQMAQSATNGGSADKGNGAQLGGVNVGDIVGAVASGVVLKGALTVIKSSTPDGMKTLGIGKSDL